MARATTSVEALLARGGLALERQGVVTRAEAVHVYDSTEYSVTWQTAVRHAAPGAG